MRQNGMLEKDEWLSVDQFCAMAGRSKDAILLECKYGSLLVSSNKSEGHNAYRIHFSCLPEEAAIRYMNTLKIRHLNPIRFALNQLDKKQGQLKEWQRSKVIKALAIIADSWGITGNKLRVFGKAHRTSYPSIYRYRKSFFESRFDPLSLVPKYWHRKRRSVCIDNNSNVSSDDEVWLGTRQVSELLDLSCGRVKELCHSNFFANIREVNGNGGRQYRIALSCLTQKAQMKYYAKILNDRCDNYKREYDDSNRNR